MRILRVLICCVSACSNADHCIPRETTKMLRRKFLSGAAVAGDGAVGAAASFPAPAIAQSLPEIKWRMPTSFPKSLDTIHGGGEQLAKRVAELTDNKFQIRVF